MLNANYPVLKEIKLNAKDSYFKMRNAQIPWLILSEWRIFFKIKMEVNKFLVNKTIRMKIRDINPLDTEIFVFSSHVIKFY